MNEAQLKKILAVISCVYPNWNEGREQEALEIWMMLIGDLDANEAARAVRTHCSTSTFPPKPADVRKLVNVSPPKTGPLSYTAARNNMARLMENVKRAEIEAPAGSQTKESGKG